MNQNQCQESNSKSEFDCQSLLNIQMNSLNEKNLLIKELKISLKQKQQANQKLEYLLKKAESQKQTLKESLRNMESQYRQSLQLYFITRNKLKTEIFEMKKFVNTSKGKQKEFIVNLNKKDCNIKKLQEVLTKYQGNNNFINNFQLKETIFSMKQYKIQQNNQIWNQHLQNITKINKAIQHQYYYYQKILVSVMEKVDEIIQGIYQKFNKNTQVKRNQMQWVIMNTDSRQKYFNIFFQDLSKVKKLIPLIYIDTSPFQSQSKQNLFLKNRQALNDYINLVTIQQNLLKQVLIKSNLANNDQIEYKQLHTVAKQDFFGNKIKQDQSINIILESIQKKINELSISRLIPQSIAQNFKDKINKSKFYKKDN